MRRDELVAALAKARDLPDDEDKIAELERVIAHADAAADLRLGFDARAELIATCHSHTEQWRMLPALDWCRSAPDRAPAVFSERDTELSLRYHKWSVAALVATPRVGLAQTQVALDDLERRLAAGRRSLQVIDNLRCRITDHLGEERAARRWLERWRAARRDENSDCAGCEPARQAELLAGWGEWSEAVRVVEPLLNGAPGCLDQPERAMVAALIPYLHLGRFEEAAEVHVRAYQRHRHERHAFPLLAGHLRFCALSGHHERGLDLLAEHLGWLDRPYDEASAMEFAAAGALVCRLATEAGSGARTLHRPSFGKRPAANLPVSKLGADLVATAEDLAGRFDARNGTNHQSGRVAAWLSARPLCAPIPLPLDDLPDEPETTMELPVDGQQVAADEQRDPPAPLRVEAVIAALDERGDRYLVTDDGAIEGRWGSATIRFDRLGEQREILHIQVIAARRLPTSRRADAYEFCNAWNHNRLIPKAYVHDTGEGELLLAGDLSNDLRDGVTPRQLGRLVATALAAGIAFTDAVDALP